MKKRLTAMLMVVALLVSLLSTGAMAVEGSGTGSDKPVTEVSNGGYGGITINKEVITDDESGQSSLSIEAYVQGSVSAPTAQPLDIVLVLDQSGSMADGFGSTTRQAAMKQAVRTFISSVAANSGEKHQMAIVTFGNNAQTLQDWTTVNAAGAQSLSSEVDRLYPSGATNVAAGMKQAESLMNSARPDAEQVVIVFTDGVPTTSSEFSTSVANNAIETAYDLKRRSVTIYTIGIFGGADPNQLYGSSGFDKNSDGTIDSQWIVDEWGFFPGWDFPEADVPAANRFLNYLSSNYANSESIGLNRDTSGLGLFHSKITYTITENFARGEGNYYLTASNSEDLTEVFEEIAGEITPSVKVGADAVLTDTMSEYFVFGDGVSDASTSGVTVTKVAATGSGEKPSWESSGEDITSDVEVSVSGGTITVKGFDYSSDENCVVKGSDDGSWQGYKLVLSFPIEENPEADWELGTHNYPTNSTTYLSYGDNQKAELKGSPELPHTKVLNGTPVTIQVYLDGKLLENPDDYVELSRYSTHDVFDNSDISLSGSTYTVKFDYDENGENGGFNCVDVAVDVTADGVFLQGVRAYENHGQSGTRIVYTADIGGKTLPVIDNIDGNGSEEVDCKIYLNTEYKVKYHLDGEELNYSPYDDSSVYIVTEEISGTTSDDEKPSSGNSAWVTWQTDVDYETIVTLPSLPAVGDGYEADGWWLEAAFSGNKLEAGSEYNVTDEAEYTDYFIDFYAVSKASTFNVIYKFVSGTEGMDTLPDEVMSQEPSDTTAKNGEKVTPANNFNPVDVDTDGIKGTWSFQSWDPTSATIDGDDVTFTGTWVFTEDTKYGVKYEFVSDNGDNLPEEVLSQLTTTDNNQYYVGVTVSNIAPGTYENVEVKDESETYVVGTWSFKEWNAQSAQMTADGVTFTGKWTFTGAAQHSVTYNWGDTPTDVFDGNGTPVTLTLPTDNNKYYAGQKYTVDVTYSKDYTVYTYDEFGNVNGQYTFSGWNDPNDGVMGEANVTVTGSWTYEDVEVAEHTITVVVYNGTATADGLTDGKITVLNNGNVTIIFEAKAGYVLDTVTVDDDPANLTDSVYTFNNVTRDYTIKVVYAEDSNKDGTPDYKQVIVYFEADKNGSVEGTLTQAFTDEDGDGTVTFTPDNVTPNASTGYAFDIWTKDNGVDGVNPFTSTTAAAGTTITYTAHFKANNPDIDITKAASVNGYPLTAGETVEVGDEITYTITVKNDGNTTFDKVYVSDEMMVGNVQISVDGETSTATLNGSYAIEPIGGFKPNDVVTLTYSYKATEDDIESGIRNTAVAEGGDTKDDDTVEIDVNDPRVSINKTVTGYNDKAMEGDELTYTITVKNTGNTKLDVTVSDDMWTYGKVSSAELDGVDIDVTSGEYKINNLDAGESKAITYTYTVTAQDVANGKIDNAATADINGDGMPDAKHEVTTPTGDPSLTVEKTAGASTVQVGTPITYTVEVKNDGYSVMNNVVISDTLWTSDTVIEANGDVTGEYDTVESKYYIEKLEPGEYVTLTYTYTPTEAGRLENKVTVTSDGLDTVPEDSVIVEVTPEPTPDKPGISVTKNVSDRTPDVGDTITYYITVKNTGNTVIDEFTVKDSMWEYGMPIYVNGALAYVNSEDAYTVKTADLEPGGSITISYTYSVRYADEGDRITNYVTVTTPGDGPSDNDYVIIDVDDITPIVPVPDDDDDTVYVPNWLNTTDHYAYIVGYEDGTIRPQNNITRAEVATIFFRLLTDNARARYWSQTNDYTDVAADSWYNNAISTLSNMGIINGYEDGTFQPNASITRAEFTAIATRFFDYTAEYDGAFNDVSRSAWYADCVQAAVDMGLVDGYPDGGFHPNSNITRAEAVTIVNRVLNRAPHEDHLLDEDEMNVWPDNVYGAWYYADMQEATNSHDYDWIRVSGERVEEWTEKLPERDWAALEQEWSSSHDA